MALSYSHAEWFVPSLKELIASEGSSVRPCVWHKAKRGLKRDGGKLIRCSNKIMKEDAQRLDQLIRELRDVLGSRDRCLTAIRDISRLVLCKNPHRLSNAETICDFWTAELTLVTPGSVSRTTIHTSKPSTSRHSASTISAGHVQEQLKLTLGTTIQCHGRGSRGDCRIGISKSNGQRIFTITRELAQDWCPSMASLDLLKELSGLVMCQRFHQGQAPSKLEEWNTLIESKKTSKAPLTNVQILNSQTTPRRRIQHAPAKIPETPETPETPTSSVWTPPCRLQSPLSTTTTPPSASSGRRSGRSSVSSEPHYQKPDHNNERPCVSPTPVSRRTRSARQGGLRSTPPVKLPAFEPIATAKTPLKAAESVMEKIRERISTNEMPAGFVYGFRRPGCDLIKIGTTTKTVSKRMRQIETKCNYTPVVIFQVATNHAMKVERLVHRQFYKQNRRECLINGVCNEGRGCPTRHKEWFEGVTVEYAEAVVRGWVRWMNLEPYDAEGTLKQAWVAQTKLFGLSASGDIWMQWTQLTLVKTIKQEEEEEELEVAIKTEKVLRKVNELSSQVVPPKSVPRDRKISSRSSGLEAPVTLSNPVAVSA